MPGGHHPSFVSGVLNTIVASILASHCGHGSWRGVLAATVANIPSVNMLQTEHFENQPEVTIAHCSG